MRVLGVQVTPIDKPFEEQWGNYPTSRRRLLRLLGEAKVRNPIFLSGDVHYGEMHRLYCIVNDVGHSESKSSCAWTIISLFDFITKLLIDRLG